MRGDKKQEGCGCGVLTLVGIIAVLLLGIGILVGSRYYKIVPRDAEPETAALQKATPKPRGTVVPVSALPPEAPMPTPPTTVDLIDLETRMQDWPSEVALESAATFPGEVVAPAGTIVKLISAGPEVEVEYKGQDARLLADQTDLVARVLSHRAQAMRQAEYDRQRSSMANDSAQRQADARAKQIEAIYGKQPAHDDAFFAIKTYLKQIQKDPDAVQMTSISDPFPAEYGGQKCWGTRVKFRVRDTMGFYQEQGGVVYLDAEKALGYDSTSPAGAPAAPAQ